MKGKFVKKKNFLKIKKYIYQSATILILTAANFDFCNGFVCEGPFDWNIGFSWGSPASSHIIYHLVPTSIPIRDINISY